MAAKTSPSWRKATLINCPDCGAYVIHGYDRDNVALPATVNTAPVDPSAERFIWQQGRRTYVLSMGELWRRYTPAGRIDGTLHVNHVCDAQPRASLSPSKIAELLGVER